MEYKCTPMLNSNNNEVIAFLCNKTKNIENFTSTKSDTSSSPLSASFSDMMASAMSSAFSSSMMSSTMMYPSISSDTK